jgi:hypothetical protein
MVRLNCVLHVSIFIKANNVDARIAVIFVFFFCGRNTIVDSADLWAYPSLVIPEL